MTKPQRNRRILEIEHNSIAREIGWYCDACDTFNGSEKERLTHCRACGEKRWEPSV